jgi:hypothetical protein
MGSAKDQILRTSKQKYRLEYNAKRDKMELLGPKGAIKSINTLYMTYYQGEIVSRPDLEPKSSK